MHLFLVAGHENFPRQNLSEIIAEPVLCEKKIWMTVINLVKWRKRKVFILSVIVRENRAEPKDRGRPFTFIFSQYKSYPKRLTTMIFAKVGVCFSSRYHHIMILASQAV